MELPKLPPRLIGMLADLLALSSSLQRREDSVAMLELLQLLRPDVVPLVLLEAWHLIEMRRFGAARELLEGTERAHPQDAMTKALLVMCLYLQGDSLWQSYIADIGGLPDNAQATAMVAAIEAVAGELWSSGLRRAHYA
jgi:hypothetical protein